MSRIVFVFLDGFGLAPPGPGNPVSQYPWPELREVLGAAPILGESVCQAGRLLKPVDAGLGVEGRPQSATGQVSLFCGVNAPALLGFHLAAYPNARLRRVIEADNLLKRVAEAGLAATFANAYTREYFDLTAAGKLRDTATTLCVRAAGLRFRMLDNLLQGKAVYWDITNEQLRARPGYEEVPLVAPEEAGQRLAALALSHHLVLFESFLPDRVGHGTRHVADDEQGAEAIALCRLLDRFLAACARALPGDTTLIVCSDHGNLEDASTPTHSENPVPLMAIGPEAGAFAAVGDISGVAPAIYGVLGVDSVDLSGLSGRGPTDH